MNPAAILALISQLYEQLSAADERIKDLEGQLEGSNGKKPVRESVGKEG